MPKAWKRKGEGHNGWNRPSLWVVVILGGNNLYRFSSHFSLTQRPVSRGTYLTGLDDEPGELVNMTEGDGIITQGGRAPIPLQHFRYKALGAVNGPGGEWQEHLL